MATPRGRIWNPNTIVSLELSSTLPSPSRHPDIIPVKCIQGSTFSGRRGNNYCRCLRTPTALDGIKRKDLHANEAALQPCTSPVPSSSSPRSLLPLSCKRPQASAPALKEIVSAPTSPHSDLVVLVFIPLSFSGCGYEQTCNCQEDVATGCVLQLDDCSQEHYWPPRCTGCGTCPEICVDCKRSFIQSMGGSC
jgi:hypothetical protein